MNLLALLSLFLTTAFVIMYGNAGSGWCLTWAITFGTISYHLVIRLFVGAVINLLMHNHVDYRKKWFQTNAVEERLYRILKVKQWKGKMGTYDPDCFDYRKHSWHEIAQATCQAELVHELIILLSFLPIFASIPFGALPVFAITSVFAASYDAMFVVMQRYNRPRIIKLVEHSEKSTRKSTEHNDNHP